MSQHVGYGGFDELPTHSGDATGEPDDAPMGDDDENEEPMQRGECEHGIGFDEDCFACDWDGYTENMG